MSTTPRTFFGIPVSPENLLKLLALVFALGALYQRLTTMEVTIRGDMLQSRELISQRLDFFEKRIERIEKVVDRQ